MKCSPISPTLISDKRDAVRVHIAITIDQDPTLVDWFEVTGKNLMTIYAIHSHVDHFFDVRFELAGVQTNVRPNPDR